MLGGTILINVLADAQPEIAVGAVFLISAPFVGEGGWPSDDIAAMSGIGRRLPQGTPVHLYHGSADETAPLAHLELYERAIPHAHARRLTGRDHQLNNDLSEVAADIRNLRRAQSDGWHVDRVRTERNGEKGVQEVGECRKEGRRQHGGRK